MKKLVTADVILAAILLFAAIMLAVLVLRLRGPGQPPPRQTLHGAFFGVGIITMFAGGPAIRMREFVENDVPKLVLIEMMRHRVRGKVQRPPEVPARRVRGATPARLQGFREPGDDPHLGIEGRALFGTPNAPERRPCRGRDVLPSVYEPLYEECQVIGGHVLVFPYRDRSPVENDVHRVSCGAYSR